FLPHVANNGFFEFVAAHPDAFGQHLGPERDDRDVDGAAADVHHHVPARLGHVDARPDGGGHGLGNDHDFFRARLHASFDDGPLPDAGDARRDADRDLRPHQGPTTEHFSNVMFQHDFGHGVIGDDAVFERTDGNDAPGSAADHLPRFFTYREDFVGRLVD